MSSFAVGVPLLFVFAGSGAAALIYEIVWLQLLQLAIGSSFVSVGILLATFMGGMGAGRLLLPRVVSARHHPLRVYATLELCVGASALALLVVIPLAGRFYFSWGGGSASVLWRGLVAAICLLPPTLAMGATLPAIARWVESTPAGVSWLGLLYAANIAGAAVGSLTAGFYLLRLFNMTVATLVGVALNVIVAATATMIAVRSPQRGHASIVGDRTPRVGVAWAAYVAIAISGFCALSGEVVWTRLLGLLFGATTYTFSIVLAVFLLGLGGGSAIGSAALRGGVRPRIAFGWSQLLLIAAMFWTARELNVGLPFWPIAPALATDVWLNFEVDFVRALWAVLPSAVLWGASFPLALAAAAMDRDDASRVVSGVYAANTIGAVAGALSASLLLVAWIGSQRTQQVMMILTACGGCLLLWPSVRDAVARARVFDCARGAMALLALGLLILRVPAVPGLLVAYGRYAATVNGQAGEIIYVGEGSTSSVAVSRLPNGRLGYHNAGKIQASSEPQDMRLQRMLGHLTTLVPTTPRSVLVIGCGAGVTAGAVSLDPAVERVTIAEIEPLVPRVVST